MTNTSKQIHWKWLSDGGFLLWSEPQLEPKRLTELLFAYHKPSFYGTFIESKQLEEIKGVQMPPHWAFDYWIEPKVLSHFELHWDPTTAALGSMARILREALENGWFAPDLAKWKNGKFGWKLLLPQSMQSNLETFMEAAREIPAEDWFNRAIAGFIDERLNALGTFEHTHGFPHIERCVEAYQAQKNLSPAVWFDEDEWLMQLGWNREAAPFRIALRLVEPSASSNWRLRVIAQDKRELEKTLEFAVNDTPAADELPENWRSHWPDKLDHEHRKWVGILQPLRDPELPHQLLAHLSEEQAWYFLAEGSLRLLESGASVFLPPWWEQTRRFRATLKTRVKSPSRTGEESLIGLQQILQFDWKLAIGNVELSEEELQAIVAEKKRLLFIRGNWIEIHPQMLQMIQKKLKQIRRKGGLTLLDILEHDLHEADPEDGQEESASLLLEIEPNEELERMLQQLKQTSKPPILDAPGEFHGELRKYQQEGLSWLIFLKKLGLGGCLADDMGLGKTIQWIAYLLYAQEKKLKSGPSLLICPTSVLGNWQKEFQRFAPSLNVYLHHGPDRKKGDSFAAAAATADVVLTSYTLAALDGEELTAVRWDALCLDEAQNIKNPHTKQSRAVRRLDTNHRIALTGTPMENRLSELWSIMDFVNPGYPGSLRAFDKLEIGQVRQLVRPFLLRRIKNDPAIELDLPDKAEMKCYVKLTVEQGLMYEQQLQSLFDRIERLSGMERRGAVLSAILKLKQVCNHPAMLTKDSGMPVAELIAQSSKVMRLLEMIEEVRDKGERCIVFTQYVEMGMLLQTVLTDQLQEKVKFMHGGISRAKRDQMIAEFQAEGVQNSDSAMILSLKTGGTGLNLTAANHVFHYDRWWNPAVENQASDRVYRIGQTKDVQVHKFITLGTLEEKIDELLEQKEGLSQQIVGGEEQWITELSTEELYDMLSLRKEWLAVSER